MLVIAIYMSVTLFVIICVGMDVRLYLCFPCYTKQLNNCLFLALVK
jgi:hypothetical protein